MSPEAIQAAVEAARLQIGLPAKSTEGDERAAALKKSRKVASGNDRAPLSLLPPQPLCPC